MLRDRLFHQTLLIVIRLQSVWEPPRSVRAADGEVLTYICSQELEEASAFLLSSEVAPIAMLEVFFSVFTSVIQLHVAGFGYCARG